MGVPVESMLRRKVNLAQLVVRIPLFSVQRRVQLAQQGLGGMGGKTGLSFHVILGRLQGEPQKSKQLGHELDSLTGAMHVIQDTLGGSLVSSFCPF